MARVLRRAQRFLTRHIGCVMLLLGASRAYAQFNTTVKPRTVEEFEQYARKVEQDYSARWEGQRAFLLADENPSEREKVLAGDLLIRPGVQPNPAEISDGLIHDWIGTVFFHNATVTDVLAVLQDFNRHRQIYPEIINSRLVRRNGNDLTGYWRVERRDSLITVVLDVEQEAHWREVSSGKWACRAYAKNISEIEDAGTPREKKLPVGEGRGFLWQLYAYWGLEATGGGVLGECRTLSLSRSVPPAVAWAATPFLQRVPRDSLANTLRLTRAATKNK